MTLRLRMACVEYLLWYMLGHYLVEHIVCGQGERLLVQQQTLCQQSVQIVWRHHVVFAPIGVRVGETERRRKRKARISKCERGYVYAAIWDRDPWGIPLWRDLLLRDPSLKRSYPGYGREIFPWIVYSLQASFSHWRDLLLRDSSLEGSPLEGSFASGIFPLKDLRLRNPSCKGPRIDLLLRVSSPERSFPWRFLHFRKRLYPLGLPLLQWILPFTYLCVLRERKNPSSLSACRRINWLSAASNLKMLRTPCFTSNAGTIELGCSDISEMSICSTSCRFSSW